MFSSSISGNDETSHPGDEHQGDSSLTSFWKRGGKRQQIIQGDEGNEDWSRRTSHRRALSSHPLANAPVTPV